MRPSTDVVVPVRGSPRELAAAVSRARALRLAPGDSLTVVDNSRRGVGAEPAGGAISRSGGAISRSGGDGIAAGRSPRIVSAPGRQSSYHARNCGAAAGAGEWILFLDADVLAPADLLDRYLASPPDERTAVLIGGVRDVAASGARRESLASRYARLRRLIDQANTAETKRPYAKTANCMIRRAAFEQAGGFADGVRSGGDADLCFRLASAGWRFEQRADAIVEHRSRSRLAALLAQRARHGSGAEWLEARYPGFAPPRRTMLGMARNLVGGVARALISAGRGEHERALLQLLDPVSNAAFDLGRRLPNAPWREQFGGRL